MRHRARRDGNHAAIVQALRDVGCTVLDLAMVGGGCPDLLAARGGRMVLIEVKNPEGKDKVSPNQAEWHSKWRGPKVVVARTVEEALQAVGIGVEAKGAA